MRHAVFSLAKVANGSGFIDDRHTVPDQTYGRLGIEVETAHLVSIFHHGQQGANRIDTKAKKRIADGATCFDLGERVGQAPADDTQQRGRAVKDRLAKDHRFRILAGKGDEFRNQGGGMLAIAIHHQNMGKARGGSGAQTVQDGSPLAAIARPDEYAQVLIVSHPVSEFFARSVSAAVDNDPDLVVFSERISNGFEELWAGIIAWDEDKMGRVRDQGGWHVAGHESDGFHPAFAGFNPSYR
jgi:hypothetical protein